MSSKYTLENVGIGKSRRSKYVDYLISQGVDVKVVDSAESIRGLSFDCVIVDEWVKEWDDENRTR